MRSGKAGALKPKYRNRGVEIAKMLWPQLELEPEGSFWDKYGIDAHLDGQTVQIKYDWRIAISGNIYHEFYEKSAYHSEQPWRKSPGNADQYIFTTETNLELIGYLITVDTLAQAETGKRLVSISPNNGQVTSIGILLPLSSLNTQMNSKRKGASHDKA